MFIKYLAKCYLNIKFHGTINDPLPVLPYSTNTILSDLAEWYILGKTRWFASFVCIVLGIRGAPITHALLTSVPILFDTPT